MLGVGCGDPGGLSKGISMFYDERIFCFLMQKMYLNQIPNPQLEIFQVVPLSSHSFHDFIQGNEVNIWISKKSGKSHGFHQRSSFSFTPFSSHSCPSSPGQRR